MVSSSKDKKWVVKEKCNARAVQKLSRELDIDNILSSLLVQRDITTYEEARTFFRPSLSMLNDPFLMTDMEKAVDRMHEAIFSKEKILIYGDYDVDGTSAVALVYSFLRNYTDNLDYYIPDRYDEGYGISYKGIDFASENGFSLIISLDCGIKAVEKIKYASAKNIEFIICDHHFPGDELPDAVAVLDPKRSDDKYPFDDLCGCGVGFKFVQGYTQKYKIPFETITPLLDLVAVSTAADLVSVIGENRILTYFGLEQLNRAPRKGLHSIIKLCGLDKHPITLDDIVFKIGPRINAAGRMESGKTAVDLLTSSDDISAIKYGNEIDEHNRERKSIDREITIEAINMVKNMNGFSSMNSTVVYNRNWHKGVVGIVASRLVETFYKPTVVLTKSNDYVTGSARSIAGFDLYEAIESCSDLLINFGGHTYAAGLTMEEKNLPAFRQRFEEFVSQKITKKILTPIVKIDCKMDFRQITPKFCRILKQFQPFGPGNPSPVFETDNVYDSGNGKKVGNEKGHLKLELLQEDNPNRTISAIAFNLSDHFEHINAGNPIDICYNIVENIYRGMATLQLRIKDIRNEEVF
ncbi:MAG: single-stranded-DNA-specific exonuclease RecJ [Bacteroidales bacterium]|jgi:single-stranded-DNA-specific exonuclease|nr:single-stranded-DNA-specific exonuclease RecJ [Bacteroidales bacterium]